MVVPLAIFQVVMSQQVVLIVCLINSNIWSIANRLIIVKLLSAIPRRTEMEQPMEYEQDVGLHMCHTPAQM